ncbi:MAG: hypothetical protein HQK60_11445 [Deltaproteobacteria bacterium]|nr:hypothetical protein [Deltaproteobacteria bacterium]
MARKRNIKQASLLHDVPEFDLWAAVLMRAIEDYREGDQDAKQYLAGEGDYPGSFNWICAMLDLEPEYIRDRLKVNRKGKKLDELPVNIRQSRQIYMVYKNKSREQSSCSLQAAPI